ncbi:VOC family protein [Paenibacillus sp. SYP-B4298]|uniref:VOC family protein n=1 Tax=Paenibacillus sp. SYP-B4298 TaxID=2996034 RepID=UPI0022DE0DB1|nr:VOC family protein [Paenibacillus sp. SYP-B4298]
MATHFSAPILYYDGSFIDVLWDNHDNAMRWFENYLAWKVGRQEEWKVDPRCLQGRMTSTNWGTWLVSYLTNSRLPHHFAERGTVESNVRLCFRVHELQELHRKWLDDGIRVSAIYDGPGETRYFDVWATTEGIRLTLQEDSSLQHDELLPSWVRVGVSNLQASVEWYKQYMGMSVVRDEINQGYVLMSLKLNHREEDSLWIIEQLSGEAYKGKVDGQVQPICWIKDREDFFTYHQYLLGSGIETSEVGGYVTGGMVSFHFYDLDGNRFNISSM